MVASAGKRSDRAPVLAKYDVREELGHGGMATVYRAHDERLARDVAIKVLHPHLRDSREIAHRFAVEAKAVAKLRHPNIVEVFDVSSAEDPEKYLVVELVRGPTLRRLLEQHGALPPEIGAAIVLELLSGVAHAHASGVIHRDVKPENVLIEHRPKMERASKGGATPVPTSRSSGAFDGEGSRSSASASGDSRPPPVSGAREGERVAIKLTDFGIAKLLDAQGVTSTGQVLGSPAHMAPEQIEGGDVDARADVFGLGVLLYECMVGRLPFVGNNPAQVLRRVLDGLYASAERERPTVGRVWSEIVDRALSRRPADRYSDALAMRDAIATELTRLGIRSPRAEIEAWLDDPEGWTAEHERRLKERLCELGAESRKRSDAVRAAADYNRALAYAPSDPQLLRIAASMHRSEARARLLRRVVPLAIGAVVLASGAYLLASAVKGGGDDEALDPMPAADRTGDLAVRPAPLPRLAPSARKPATKGAATTAPAATGARTIATPVVAPKPAAQRTIRLTRLKPDFGVHLTIDGAPAPDPDLMRPFTLDDKAHTLVFTCASDLCTPKTINVAAGDKDEALSVELAIANAKLAVEGDPGHSYGIVELPHLNIAGGGEVEVPMTTGSRTVHVFDRNDPSSRSQSVSLTAGKRASVTFGGR